MPGHPRAASRGPAFLRAVDFALAPFLVIWETTQSCALACRHCRASAEPGRDPRELTTGEGFSLVDQVAEMGTPILVLSGGDPVNRPDLLDRIRHGKSGNRFLFVSHRGEIMPSGFLPIPVRNVREMRIADAYRDAPFFRKLRSPETLKGRCGRCELRDNCGGSRSWAYGLAGDPFETDPWCSYEPLGFRDRSRR